MSPIQSPAASLRRSRPEWVDVLLPREHGSWSLALEPLALGLMATPSLAGSALALAAVAGFLARRPLKLIGNVSSAKRQATALRVLLALGGCALVAFTLAMLMTSPAWLGWWAPSAAAGAGFLVLDLRADGRAELAEVLGAAAFGGVAGAIAIAGGAAPVTALALTFAMLARAIPSVLFVRARVRGTKSGHCEVVLPLTTATLAVFAAAWLTSTGVLPATVAIGLAVLWLRAAVLLRPGFALRARTIGIQEMVLGIVYVVATGVSWAR